MILQRKFIFIWVLPDLASLIFYHFLLYLLFMSHKYYTANNCPCQQHLALLCGLTQALPLHWRNLSLISFYLTVWIQLLSLRSGITTLGRTFRISYNNLVIWGNLTNGSHISAPRGACLIHGPRFLSLDLPMHSCQGHALWNCSQPMMGSSGVKAGPFWWESNIFHQISLAWGFPVALAKCFGNAMLSKMLPSPRLLPPFPSISVRLHPDLKGYPSLLVSSTNKSLLWLMLPRCPASLSNLSNAMFYLPANFY